MLAFDQMHSSQIYHLHEQNNNNNDNNNNMYLFNHDKLVTGSADVNIFDI
jgi:hypothetical protein